MKRTPKNKEPKVRLSLDLPERTRDRIESLRVRTEAASTSEVIRRGMVVYEAMWHEIETGGSVIIRSKNGIDREIMMV